MLEVLAIEHRESGMVLTRAKREDGPGHTTGIYCDWRQFISAMHARANASDETVLIRKGWQNIPIYPTH